MPPSRSFPGPPLSVSHHRARRACRSRPGREDRRPWRFHGVCRFSPCRRCLPQGRPDDDAARVATSAETRHCAALRTGTSLSPPEESASRPYARSIRGASRALKKRRALTARRTRWNGRWKARACQRRTSVPEAMPAAGKSRREGGGAALLTVRPLELSRPMTSSMSFPSTATRSACRARARARPHPPQARV